MTTHMLQPDQIVIQPDRRQKGSRCYFDAPLTDLRKTPHNYSKPQRIAYVKVEPVPKADTAFIKKLCNGEYYPMDKDENVNGYPYVCPYSPNDLLVIAEEWVSPYPDKYTVSEFMKQSQLGKPHELRDMVRYLRAKGQIQPPSTMPPELAPHCKEQFKVGKIVGCELRKEKRFPSDTVLGFSTGMPAYMKQWHFQIIESEEG